MKRTAVTLALTAGLLAAGSPAHAAAPTPTTPANARTFGSCTVAAPGGQLLIGTALADTFGNWRGTRYGALGTSSRFMTSRTVFKHATLVVRDRADRNVLTSTSTRGYWLHAGRDPQPGDRAKVTITWQTYRAGLPFERRSCEARLPLPRSFGNLV